MIKKVISILLLLIFMTTNSCYAYSKLYYIKNVKTEAISPIVSGELQHRKFNIIKSNPYYAVSEDGDDNATIILQQSGENLFYYYQSNNNKRVNRDILKQIKKQDIVYEESMNSNIIQIYDNLAQNVIPNNNNNQYTFEVPAVNKVPTQQVLPQKTNSFSGYVAQVPSGTEIPVYLQSPINTATASVGDTVIAVVSSNVDYNGNVIIPQGSTVYGRLAKARPATYGSRNGRVVIEFENIVTPDNKRYNVSTEVIDFTVSNDGKVASSAKSVAAYAALGALAGLLVALLSSSDKNVGSAVAIGAGIGAGSSLVYSTAEKGVDAEIPSYTELNLLLTHPLKVSISNY